MFEAASVMIPSEPCHTVVFIAALAVVYIEIRRRGSVRGMPGMINNEEGEEGRTIAEFVYAALPVTAPRTARPSTYLPEL